MPLQVETYSTYDALLGASWEIDLWGKIRRQSEAAPRPDRGQRGGRQGVILTLVASVAGGYINLRDLDRQLEIAKATARVARGVVQDLQGPL
jgi:multidrug efflux system outer membrane protein